MGGAWTALVTGLARSTSKVRLRSGSSPSSRSGRSVGPSASKPPHGLRLALPAILAIAALLLAALPLGAQAQPDPITVDVDLFEWGIRPSVTTVPAGVPVHFVARNTGGFSHQLALSAPNARGAVLAPGESYTVEVTFGAAATIQLFCPIGDVPLLPGVSHRQRGMDTALTVTAPPAGVTIQATPAIAPAPQIAALTAPGATEDRVGLPDGYQQRFGTFYVFDRSDNRQVRHVFGNTQALSAREGQKFPFGSILVMETWRARLGADNQPALDAAGRYQKDELTGIFVMRKELGFGAKYGPDQTGEWEYVAYRPDGSGFQTAPDRSQACAQCHLAASDDRNDWVVRAALFFSNPQRALGGILSFPRTGAGASAAHSTLPAASLAPVTPVGPIPSAAAPILLTAIAPALTLAALTLRRLRR